MDSVVDKTLSLPPAEVRKRDEHQVTLMEALAMKKPDRKVCIEVCENYPMIRIHRLIFDRAAWNFSKVQEGNWTSTSKINSLQYCSLER